MSAIGMQGDLFRGAKAIGMSTPCDFSLSALEFALQKNPDCLSFCLTVNPFAVDLARKVLHYWMDTTAPSGVHVDIVTDAHYAQFAWLLEPLDAQERTAYTET